MNKEIDPLIKLAALELNIDLTTSVSAANCALLCEKLYDFADQDGYNVMNISISDCVCKKPKPIQKPIEKP